jgi:hypothetical protein
MYGDKASTYNCWLKMVGLMPPPPPLKFPTTMSSGLARSTITDWAPSNDAPSIFDEVAVKIIIFYNLVN